jgi:hypothetical protein
MMGLYKMNGTVRVVHIPTGIAAEVCCERGQFRNRQRAMELVKNRLYALANIERVETVVRTYRIGEGAYGLPDAEVDALIDAPRLAQTPSAASPIPACIPIDLST